MKKALVIFLTLIMIFAFAGCNKFKEEPDEETFNVIEPVTVSGQTFVLTEVVQDGTEDPDFTKGEKLTFNDDGSWLTDQGNLTFGGIMGGTYTENSEEGEVTLTCDSGEYKALIMTGYILISTEKENEDGELIFSQYRYTKE